MTEPVQAILYRQLANQIDDYMVSNRIYNFKLMISSQGNSSQRRLWTIKREYLSLVSYESAKRNSAQLNQLYNELCQIFIINFQALHKNQLLTAHLKPEAHAKDSSSQHPNMVFLGRFTVDFTTIINQIAHYQISCLLRLQEQNKPEFQAYFQLAKKCKRLDGFLNELQGSKFKLESIFKQIKLDFITYKQSEADPIKHYDRKYAINYNQRLLRNIDEAQLQIRAIEDRRQSMQQHIADFQSIFSKLKCKLVKNKYAVLKKVNLFVENGKSYMAQLLELLRECVVKHKQLYSQAIEEKAEESNQLKDLLRKSTQISIQNPLDENKRWEKSIKATLGLYYQENESIEKILHRFQDYLCAVCKSFQESKGRLQQIVARLSHFYEVKETPYEQLQLFLEMHGQLHARVLRMSEKINGMILLLRQQKRECMKHGQIVLSVIKIKNMRRESLLDLQESMNKKDISALVSQIAFSSPKEQILSFYQLCINTQLELLRSVNKTIKLKKKQTADSMEISHSVPHFTVAKKKPLKEQIWLWRQPKEELKVNLQQYQLQFDDVRKFIDEKTQRFANKDSMKLQQYQCVLLPQKKQATLTIMSQGIGIVVNAKQLHLQLGWKDITNLSEESCFLYKTLVVDTAQGKIQLIKFKQDIPTIIKSIQQIQEKSLTKNQPKIQPKRQVTLTQEEIKQIERRREKIKSEIPSTDDFRLIIEEVFEGQRIDQVYDLVYSDKPFSFYGRQQPCFFSYTGKKSGNFNWVPQKYDKPGPEFYTLEEGVTFKNCPLFSTRKISYNHPMKPTSIPFMPKQSRNVDERRMYWVSHEELVYCIRSLTFEVPMCDNFEVHIIHRITKTPNAVKIQILSKILFVKETSFKNIIISNSDPLIDENMIEFMGQIRKLLKLRKEVASGAKLELEPQPQSPAETNMGGQGDAGKLRLYNMVLLVGVLLLVLLNLSRWL